jgi:hypothetical protein
MHFTARTIQPERMDDPAVDPDELARALAFLRWVNGPLGGGAAAAIAHLRRWTEHWPCDEVIRLLDLGTGAADIPLAIAAWASRQSPPLRVRITAVDRHETTLAIARGLVGDNPDIELVSADALRLMDRFDPDSFHFAHAGLFLHHLQDIEVVTVLRIMDRMATHGLIWNDLIRSPLARSLVRLVTAFARMPGIGRVPDIARHDARVSVEAGFTRHEAVDLARRAGWLTCGGGETIQYSQRRLYRFTLSCRKRA